MSDAVAEALVARKDEILERLKALLRLPSVSTDPAYAEGMKATRDFLHGPAAPGPGCRMCACSTAAASPAMTGAWNGRARQADADHLRPLRRAAARPARPVEDARPSSRPSATAGSMRAAPRM